MNDEQQTALKHQRLWPSTIRIDEKLNKTYSTESIVYTKMSNFVLYTRRVSVRLKHTKRYIKTTPLVLSNIILISCGPNVYYAARRNNYQYNEGKNIELLPNRYMLNSRRGYIETLSEFE